MVERNLVITDSVYQKNKFSKKNKITFDMNYINLNEKIDLENIKNLFYSFPIIDPFKFIEVDVSLYTLSELKEIISFINENTDVLFYYFLKSFDDKLDKKIETLFKNEKFKIHKKSGVDLKQVSNLLKSNNLDISPSEFINEGNMDNVVNDINKIISLNDKSNYKSCLTECFESNVFKLIEYIVNNDGINALKTLNVLDEPAYVINLILLKHFILLKGVLENRDITKIDIANGGAGKAIHPYRLKLLKNTKPKININSCIQILLSNELKKNIDMEMTILKILN